MANDAVLFRAAAVSSVVPSSPAVATSAQQRFLEVNTTMFPDAVVATVASLVVTGEQQQFLDVNAMWLPVGTSNSYGEEVTPTIGHPR